MARRQGDAILIGENVSLERQVAAVVASGQPNLRLWIGSRAPADNRGTYGKPGEETGNDGSGSARSWFTLEVVASSGKPKPLVVEKKRREHMRLLHTPKWLVEGETLP